MTIMNDVAPIMMDTQDWIDRNPLKMWLDEHKSHNQRVLASNIGVSPITVHHWVKGVKIPRAANMEKIEMVTGIENLADAWSLWLQSRPVLLVI